MNMGETLSMVGWREWVTLPDLGVDLVKAKIDTGARTSALHAFKLEVDRVGGALEVFFSIHPRQRSDTPVIDCQAPLLDQREVKDSGGHVERRCVIATTLVLGERRLTAEVTLTDRDNMGFRMLVGRTAIRGIFAVDPARSYLQGRRRERKAALQAQATAVS